jgi:hypothetical protein
VLIDCDTCTVRGLACTDCVVTVLLGMPSVELDDTEQAAISVLAAHGLVPPLRLVTDVRLVTAPGVREAGAAAAS